MKRLPLGCLLLLATAVSAEEFARPIPQAQSATAEFWFGLASVLLLLALYWVHRLVSTRGSRLGQRKKSVPKVDIEEVS